MRAVVVVAATATALTTACGALLDLPPLEVIDEPAPTTPGTSEAAVDGAAPLPGADGGDAATCVESTPLAERCAKCGVGCDDATACGIATDPCSDAGPACCKGFECKNDKCNACVQAGVSCASTKCCGVLRCRTTDYKCVACGEAGAPCGAIGTPCCSGNCDIVAGSCKP